MHTAAHRALPTGLCDEIKQSNAMYNNDSCFQNCQDSAVSRPNTPKSLYSAIFPHTLHRFITFIDFPNVYTWNIHLLKLLAASVINLCGFSVMDSNTKALFQRSPKLCVSHCC